MWTTYILYSAEIDRFYVGQTGNLAKRLNEHLNGKTQSTRRASDWVPVFAETFPSQAEAMALERKIKR